ncbi:hypothetical protein LTR08_006225 [Meristemomyces frigidus]|nr:hypothetical protein LTR08_006225 [Meristemomyces frigidus]
MRGPRIETLGKAPLYDAKRKGETHALLGTDLCTPGSTLSWITKLAMLLNDALNQRAGELKIDGMYFVTFPGHSPKMWSNEYRWCAGPAVFFAPFVRSAEDRLAWASASAYTKQYLQHPGVSATMLSDDKKTLGGYVDVFNKTVLFAPVSELRQHTDVKRSLTQLHLQGPSSLKNKKWVLSRQLRTDVAVQDPIVALLQAGWNMTQESPEEMLGYQEARSWYNRALRLMSKGSGPPPPAIPAGPPAPPLVGAQ